MDIVGITFGEEMRGYVAINALKISKWFNPNDRSLDVIFCLTIEHMYVKDEFKKVRELYVYFPKEDIENITVDRHIIEEERERLERSEEDKSKEHELQKKISPLKGYIHPILTDKVTIEDDGERKRVKVELYGYEVNEETKKRNIFFSLRSKRGIVSSDKTTSTSNEISWHYCYMIEPYLVQTLKWNNEEFMPPIDFLEIWLQIPKVICSSLSAIDIRPVSHLSQMFFLGKEISEEFLDAKQPLAHEDTLCITWNFFDVSVSSLPEEVGVIYCPESPKKEEKFVESLKKDPRNSILTLREIFYMCRFRTLDFRYIILNVSDKNLKNVLEIFNIMIFQRYLRSMEENLRLLLSELENLKDLAHYEEFFSRYEIFYTLITCKRSDDFFSEYVSSKIRKFQELKNVLDPDYMGLMQDLITLSETTRKFNLYKAEEDKSRYWGEVLSMIDNLDSKWDRKLIHPDKYIFYSILTNWRNIAEKEFEELVPEPKIDATIKTRRLALAETIGLVLSIKNSGEGEMKEVQARLLEGNDYDILTRESETKALLTEEGSFEPELIIKPRNEKNAIISYEICYKDTMKKNIRKKFNEPVEFTKKEIKFQKIENPYIIGDAIRDSKMFFGREELITNIVANFKGRTQVNPIFLYGQRRTGKTSVLLQLKEKLKDNFVPILFTLSETSNKKSFYQDLMEKIKKELDITDIEIPNIGDDPFDGFKNEFYPKIRQKLEGKKLVLMIDEYHQIDQFITEGRYDDSVIDFLNALVQDGEIKFILTGFLKPEELQSHKWMELMRFFTTMNVSFLEREEAVKLICEPVKGLMEYDDGGIEKIISLGGCHPYFTQLICHVMVEYHNRDKINIIGYDSVAKHLFVYFERGDNIFSDVIIDQTKDVERKILFHIHDLLEKKKETSAHKSKIELELLEDDKNITVAEIGEALSRLERKEIIKRSAEHPEYYEFAIDLYRHWTKWKLIGRYGGEK